MNGNGGAAAWAQFGGWVRIVVGMSVLIAALLYAGRFLERMDTLSTQVGQLSAAVESTKQTTVKMQLLDQQVQMLNSNMQTLAAGQMELRRDVDRFQAGSISRQLKNDPGR